MYVKMQKDLTDSYLIIEGKNVEFSTEKFEVSFKEYFEKYVPHYLKYNEKEDCSANLNYIQIYLFYNCDRPNTHPVTIHDEQFDAPEMDSSNQTLMISGVIVDGVRYFTCGHIYIMNDNGKTIQSV